MVPDRSGGFFRSYQCQRRGRTSDRAGHVWSDGKLYCRQHDPNAVAKRLRASDERYRAERLAERPRLYGRQFMRALMRIASGHNDARGLATQTLDEFDEDWRTDYDGPR